MALSGIEHAVEVRPGPERSEGTPSTPGRVDRRRLLRQRGPCGPSDVVGTGPVDLQGSACGPGNRGSSDVVAYWAGRCASLGRTSGSRESEEEDLAPPDRRAWPRGYSVAEPAVKPASDHRTLTTPVETVLSSIAPTPRSLPRRRRKIPLHAISSSPYVCGERGRSEGMPQQSRVSRCGEPGDETGPVLMLLAPAPVGPWMTTRFSSSSTFAMWTTLPWRQRIPADVSAFLSCLVDDVDDRPS